MKKILKYIAFAALGVLGLAGCDKKNNSTLENNNTNNNGENNTNTPVVENIDLSDLNYNLEKEYFYSDYNEKSLADTNRQGIKTFETKDDIVFDAVTYEELVGLLESDGYYLILLGGSWCHNTRAAAPFINDFAKQYGIKTIYNFDFYLDGTNSKTHIRNTTPTDPTKATPGTEYNYLYGELVSKYLTNLSDYVEYKTNSRSSVNYTNASDEVINVAKLQVPFLFLYNKNNTVNNSGLDAPTTNANNTFPIVYGFEEMIDLDANGVYKTSGGQKTYFTEDYKTRLKTVFDYIKDNNISLNEYSDAKYIKDFYNLKSNTQIFAENDKINLKTLTYRQLIWLLNQEGNSIIFLGGTWCGNTHASVKTTNDYAVKNDVVIYNFDTKLDSGYAKKYWNYKNDLHIRDTANSFVNLYTDLIENYFTNIVTLYDVNDEASYKHIEYTNSQGEIVKVKKLQVPYLLSYNKDAKDADGFNAPITSYYEEMLVLSETSQAYVYSDTNYASIKTNTKNVVNTYLKTKNKEAKDI